MEKKTPIAKIARRFEMRNPEELNLQQLGSEMEAVQLNQKWEWFLAGFMATTSRWNWESPFWEDDFDERDMDILFELFMEAVND
jgi:hypothetical protein